MKLSPYVAALRAVKLAAPVIGSSEFLRARDKLQCRISDCGGGETMVITEIGYLFLTLSAVAVLLFCCLGCACFWSPRRDK